MALKSKITTKRKRKKTTFGKAFKSSKGEKFVLFVGDEGAILVHVDGRLVKSRHFVPDASASNLEELKQIFSASPAVPLLLIVDNAEQTYMQQTLPPVSSLSVQKLIKRRLDRDFADNDIKGAILLGREKTSRRDWNFLMVALEKTPRLASWLDFIGTLSNRFIGIHLVSAEAEILVRGIEYAMKTGSGNEKESEWKFFVSHNKVGGFRQVILHRNKMIFTRLVQPVGESSPEVIAGNIEQEMSATIEYMKRLSYNPQTGLDIYIIVSDVIKNVLETSKLGATNVEVLTPFEVAGYLGIKGATQPTDQFADVVVAAAISISRSHVLTLHTPESRRITGFYPLIWGIRILGTGAALALLVYMGNDLFTIYSINSDIHDLEAKRLTKVHELDSLKAEMKNSPIDFTAANTLILLYKEFLSKRRSPEDFIEQLEPALQLPIAIKALSWSSEEEKGKMPAAPLSGSPGSTLPMNASVSIDFPATLTDPAQFTAAVQSVLLDFQKMYPSYDVKYSKLPTGYQENEKTNIDFGKTATPTQVIIPEAQITITGPSKSPTLPVRKMP